MKLNVCFPDVRPHHHPVHSSHGWGRHPGRPHRHHLPWQAVLRWLLPFPEDSAGDRLLPDPGQERLRPDTSVLQEFCQHRLLQENREGKHQFSIRKRKSDVYFHLMYLPVKPLCPLFRRTTYQRAVLMLVWAANRRVKPPPLVRTDTKFAASKFDSFSPARLTLQQISFFIPSHKTLDPSCRRIPHLKPDIQARLRGSPGGGSRPWTHVCLALPVR